MHETKRFRFIENRVARPGIPLKSNMDRWSGPERDRAARPRVTVDIHTHLTQPGLLREQPGAM